MDTKQVEALAKSGAKKICGTGYCIAGYACGHSNKAKGAPEMRMFGKATTCPLAKYTIEPLSDGRKWWEVPASETDPTPEEFSALCESCEHYRKFEGRDLEDFDTFSELMHEACIDCPVKMVMDNMSELAAEAAMS